MNASALIGKFLNNRTATTQGIGALGAAALVSMVAALISGVPAMAQGNEFGASGFVYDLGVDGMVMEADFQGRLGVRYYGRGGPVSPLDGDEITPFYGGPIGCFDARPTATFPTVGADDQCRLAVQFVNTTPDPLSGLTLRHDQTGTEVHVDELAPAAGVILRLDTTFGRPTGLYAERFAVVARGPNGGPFSRSGEFKYEVEARRPTSPQHLIAHTSDPTRPYASWDPPTGSGGQDLTGYRVRLVRENVHWNRTNFDPAQRFLFDRLVCDLAGNPDVKRCEVPNDLLLTLPVGDGFRFAVQASNAVGDGYVSYSDPFNLLHPSTPVLNPPVPVPSDPLLSYATAGSVDQIVTAQNYVQSLDAPILRFYQAYFDRRPDTEGGKYWLQIRRLGFDQTQIAAFMAESQEFQNSYGGTSNRQYVAAVYLQVLGRGSDPAGFDYWLGLLDRNLLDRAGVVRWITSNAEFINDHAFVPAGPVPGPPLSVQDPDSNRVGYDANSFSTWDDENGDCQNARDEALIRDSLDVVELTTNGCSVLTGRWVDLYTGSTFTSAGDVAIDHFIPLAEAHRSGAWRWDDARRELFANNIEDPVALRVVGKLSNQSKGDSTPAEWLPRREAQCDYVVDWAVLKARWSLTVTQPEADVIATTAARCGFAVPSFSYG